MTIQSRGTRGRLLRRSSRLVRRDASAAILLAQSSLRLSEPGCDPAQDVWLVNRLRCADAGARRYISTTNRRTVESCRRVTAKARRYQRGEMGDQ